MSVIVGLLVLAVVALGVRWAWRRRGSVRVRRQKGEYHAVIKPLVGDSYNYEVRAWREWEEEYDAATARYGEDSTSGDVRVRVLKKRVDFWPRMHIRSMTFNDRRNRRLWAKRSRRSERIVL